MSADAIDTKSPWDWVYVWLAANSVAVTKLGQLQNPSNPNARDERVKNALRYLERAEWWPTSAAIPRSSGSSNLGGGSTWEMWHGSVDIAHVQWLTQNIPTSKIIRAWLPSGLEVGLTRDADGVIIGTPTWRELSPPQEAALASDWVAQTGYAGGMWWPGRPCGMPQNLWDT